MLEENKYKKTLQQKIKPIQNLVNEIISMRKQILFPSLSKEESNDIDDLWDQLTYSKSPEDVFDWILSFREYLWGNQYEWQEARQWLTIEDEEYYLERIFRIVGEPFFKKLSDNSFIEKINILNDISVEENINKEIYLMSEREKYNNNNNNKIEINEGTILNYSRKISKKYHLKSISSNYNLSLNEIWSYLTCIDKSLKEIAVLLDIKNEQIGMNKLSLSFEINNENEYYYYSSKEKTIYFGLKFYGLVSEAWMNFIDNIIGEKYNITNENINYLSHLSFSTLGDVNDDIFDLKQDIRNKFSLNNSISSSLFVMKNTLETLPVLISHIQVNDKIIKEFIENRVFDLKSIIVDISANDDNKSNYNRWLKWREESEIMWSTIEDSKEKQKVYRSWVYTIALVEKLSLGTELPKHKMWYIFSVFKDKIKNKEEKYWSSYERLFSRSFASYLNEKIKNNNCLSGDKTNPMLYPLNKELAFEIDFWNKWINFIINICYD